MALLQSVHDLIWTRQEGELGGAGLERYFWLLSPDRGREKKSKRPELARGSAELSTD